MITANKIITMLKIADSCGAAYDFSQEQIAVIGKAGDLGIEVLNELNKMDCIIYWFPVDTNKELLRWRLPHVNKIIALEGENIVTEEMTTRGTVIIDASVYFDLEMRRHDAVCGSLYSKGCIVKYVH